MPETGDDVVYSLYYYFPNQGAAIFFTVIFGLSAVFHLWQCIRYKSFKVTALFPVSCLVFTTALAIRSAGARQTEDLGIFLAQLILIYAAPPILELANYHVLGRSLYYVPYCSPLHPGRTLTTFGSLSAIVEVLNGLGAAWAYTPVDTSAIHSAGEALVKASLILQIVVVVLFLTITGSFHARCAKIGVITRNVQGPLLTMYLSSFFILVRCIFRTVEIFIVSGTATSASGLNPIVRYEWFFYVFDAAPMLLDCLLWNIRHPRRYLPEKYTVYLERDGVTEIEGVGWQDGRSFLVTVCDPFGIFTRDRRLYRRKDQDRVSSSETKD